MLVLEREVADPGDFGLVAHLFHTEEQVCAVKTGHNGLGALQAQHAHNIGAHALGRRCSEGRDHRTLRQRRDETRDVEVAGAEILAPLRHAVRLVHRHKRYADAIFCCRCLGKCQEARLEQALGRHVHDLVPALAGALEHGVLLRRRKGGVKVAGTGARRLERTDLVAHERDERAHHEGDSRKHERGDLVADGFSRAGRHDAQGIAAG